MCCLSLSFTTSPFIKVQGLCVKAVWRHQAQSVCVRITHEMTRRDAFIKKSLAHMREIHHFTFTKNKEKRRLASAKQAPSAHIWQAPGCFCTLSCIAAVFWKEASRAACFSTKGKRGSRAGRRGHAQCSYRPAVPNRAQPD